MMRPFRPDRVPPILLSPESDAWLKAGGFDLEIGAGQGLHAIRYCQSHPERRLLAIERTKNKFNAFKQRWLNHPNLKNLLPLHADAISVISQYIEPGCLEHVFLLYPNPYPKNRHGNLRWHNSPFMAQLLSAMTASAELHLATNLRWYADEAILSMRSNWQMECIQDRQISSGMPPRTHFERKYLGRGEVCYDLVFARARMK